MNEKYKLKQVQVRLRLEETEPLYSTEALTSPEKAVKVMADVLSQMDREYFCVVNLDNAMHPINFNIVSIGDVNHVEIPIQNVFKSAILSNAASVMLLHNHPGGSFTESEEDLELTKKVVTVGKFMNIPVIDHIIVAGGSGLYTSLHSLYQEMFSARKEAARCAENEEENLIRKMPHRKGR